MGIKKSPWVSFFNSGGCNGCTLEVFASFNPKHDLERFGCKLTESVRHADVLIISGPVTEQSKEKLKKVYSQMPKGAKVIGVGACTISKGVFHDGYNAAGPLDKHIPVDIFVPGCPPRPEAIIGAVLEVLKDG
jgi:membrane-bound hydrogenase subunit mbhJ